MDPCQFVRVVVGNLALKIPVAARPARSGVHPSTSPCYCKIRLNNLPSQTALVPLAPPDSEDPPTSPASAPASFHLSRADVDRLAGKSFFSGGGGRSSVKVAIYTGRRGTTCGVNSGKLLGKVTVAVDLKKATEEGGKAGMVFHSGWVAVGGRRGAKAAQVHLTVRAERDPRFVFEFDGEPECSPQVFQVQGNMRQPVFTCKFSCRSAGDRGMRSRSAA